MKNKWLLIAVLFPALTFSQESLPGLRFNTNLSAGVVAGQSTAKPLFQLIPGLRYDRYFTGIGIGLDFYDYKTIPVFADWRMSFGKTGSAIIYGNGGYNFPFNNKDYGNDFFKTTDRFYGGFYMDAGLGYRIRLSSWHHLLFSAGYSRKNIVNKIGYTYQCFMPPCNEEVYYYHYSLGRIVTKLSWELGK